MEMVDRNEIGDSIVAEDHAEVTDFVAAAHARPIVSRESDQDLEREEMIPRAALEESATAGREEYGLYSNANHTEHVVLESNSSFFGVAMDDDDDTSVRQISLNTLAEGSGN